MKKRLSCSGLSVGFLMSLLVACGHAAYAQDGVSKQCALLFGAQSGCQCATDRLRNFATSEDYAVYSAFGDTVDQLANSNTTLRYFDHYSQALRSHTEQAGEASQKLKQTIMQMSGLHGEAMQRCGLGNSTGSAAKGRSEQAAADHSRQRELTEDDVLNDVHQKAIALTRMCDESGNKEGVCRCAVNVLKKQVGGRAVADFDRLVHGFHQDRERGLKGREAWEGSVASEAARLGRTVDEILDFSRTLGEAFEAATNTCHDEGA